MTATAKAITIVSQDGRSATVSIPVCFRQRGGRKQILSPPGTAPWSAAPRIDTALVKAMVRAHRWRHMLESGEYASSAELARSEKVNDSYLSRILRLTLIAPDITEAILTGCQPNTLQLDDLLKPMPPAWAEQYSALFDPR
jgi:predicted nucleic acid-binding Zn ribbon protein